jgi:hypothetical protein
MNNQEHKLVNWESGMDVGFAQFRQLENYFIERLCDNQSSRLNKNNYGLLPSPNGRSDSSEFDISERVTGQVEIKLHRCNALTYGGCRISYNPEQSDYLLYTTHTFDSEKESNSADTQYWDVILTVNPFDRVPVGIPDADTVPPRHPDASELYSLSIAPQGKTNHELLGLYHLIIGRIRQSGGRYEVDTNYIPPSTSMNSHPDLLKYYEQFGVYLNDIERSSKKISFKIKNRTQNTPLAYNICGLCNEISRYIASIYFLYRNEGRYNSPLHTVNYFSTLAHVSYMGLNLISKTDKEELLKYLYEWSDVTPGSFEDMLASALSIIYEHHNIRVTMLEIDSFLRILSELLIKLSTLEYIGQHKDNIVVSERMQQTETVKPKSGWTILD